MAMVKMMWVVTVATDSMERYPSVMNRMKEAHGALDEAKASAFIESIYHGATLDWIQEGTLHNRARWHNLKYYTWVEQQGKSVQELDAQKDPAWWIEHQEMVADIDKRLLATRGR